MSRVHWCNAISDVAFLVVFLLCLFHCLSITITITIGGERSYMDNHQDQGHEGRACRCSECRWPSPNPNPCPKKSLSHKNKCGTIEGYELSTSERQTHSNASESDDDEHLSDDDPHSQGPNSLDPGNNEKLNVGTRKFLSSSGDELFLDAIANFSDGAPSPGSKEPLRDSHEWARDVEIGNIKYQEFSSGSSDFNDINQFNVKGQMQEHSILQRERVKEGNMLEMQGQLSGSHVHPPSSSSITDLRTIERIDDCFGLSSDSNPSKAEATPDMMLENKIHTGENVRPCSLASVAKETNLKENDETKSDSDMFDISIFSDNAVSDRIALSDVVNSDSQVARGAFNLEEKNNADLLSLMLQEELSLEVNSTISSTNTSTNSVQVNSAHTIQFATSGDAKTLQEMGEENVNMFTSPVCDDSADVAHPQNECADFKDHKGVLPQNPLSPPSSEAGKPKQDDLKDSDDEENYFHINQNHLSGKRQVLPPDGRVLDSSMKEQESWEIVAEEMHAEESIGVSSVNFMTENDKASDEIGISMNRMKLEMYENYMGATHFSDKPSSGVYKSDDVVEMDKFEKCDITDAQYTERLIVKDSSLPKPAGSNFERSILSEAAMDFYARTPKDIECANKSSLSGAQEDNEDNEIKSSCRVNKECNRFISTSTDSRQTQNAELLVKAAEEPGRNSSLYSLDVEPSAQCVSVVGETQGEHGREVYGITDVPVQDQSGLPSNLNDPKAASEGQQHPSSTSSQAGWFPTLTQAINESQGRKKNEEIVAEITNRNSEQKTPPQSPLSEAANSNKLESPKLEESSIFGKNGESAAAAKAVKGEGEKGSNSSADIRRKNKKVKSKLYCTPCMCCSSVDSPPR
ncbi:hypothetical protein JHK82_048963 [Glycine max]|uniref:Uncharacterized protein n=3 Tax=Glycine subgen. Soja TaxID=1462606 RepID=K7MP65_SOYBN|nr:uncharacterized protein LOC114395748 [Glycine soja]KAG5090185.1 hypothetical protein JHK82_048963 [Glycine max]KAH1152519.1 hypothetical protein GYH30_048579 [Glycine max]KRG97363.1 hypothetical protein GLYMA_18G003300v4 [Glycine max]|eukprot:XP_014625819.1 uncharacterized protein LOC100788785 [Glycine max]